ncbi:hypothetical protein C3E79_04760 [Corynebacterium liangguodongii]|uniref:Uncharacterized protein n=2 Tax=Corynebacterium liangguodongii TaxID=2079535 RepID=A0A2S0WH53_9CORY|nr:hypothetical protein C3E79_04760 [Corynebacterium liangguodongii]PWB99102.1 hypothetical protein DF219_08410 [Corynebacterium liangguodongii]
MWRGVIALAAAAALASCSVNPLAGPASPLDSARARNQSRHVSERFEDHPVVIDDPSGVETSRLFFSASETVVVTDGTVEAQLRGASVAVTAHAPMISYSPQRHVEVIREIERLKAHTVLTVGQVALAPTTGALRLQRDPGGLEALHTMTSLRFDIRDVPGSGDPGAAVSAVAGLPGDPPTWLRTPDAPAIMPGAAARPFPLQSRRDADMAPVVVATRESSLASVTNARSFGASVEVLDEPDPRRSDGALYAMAGLADGALIALGPQFGSAAELTRNIMQAEE